MKKTNDSAIGNVYMKFEINIPKQTQVMLQKLYHV